MSKSFSQLSQTRFGHLSPFILAAAIVLAATVGCDMTANPGNNGNDNGNPMDMSSNGASAETTPDDGMSDGGNDSDSQSPTTSPKIELEVIAIATEQDILGQLNIELDQTLNVADIQSKAKRIQKTQADVSLTKSGNTIAVSGSLVGGIKERQVLIGAKFLEVTRMPIAIPIDGLQNESIKAFTTPPPGGLSFLNDDDYIDLPGLNDLDGGVVTDVETTPDLESLRAAFLDSTIKEAILNQLNNDATGMVISGLDVTVFNQQRTTFIHRNEFGDANDLEDDFSIAVIAADPQVATVQSGFVLDVTPTVKGDRMIELQIYPGSRGIVFARSKTEQIGNHEYYIEMPVFQLSTVQASVTVPDGGTVLLGGIKRLSEATNERGVPVLSKVPYINRLFKNTAAIRDEQSLMLMVTPRIIIQDEKEE